MEKHANIICCSQEVKPELLAKLKQSIPVKMDKKDYRFIYTMIFILYFDRHAVLSNVRLRDGLRYHIAKEFNTSLENASKLITAARMRYKCIQKFKEEVNQYLREFEFKTGVFVDMLN